jgi:Icc-related predicted phosphoesterase
MRIVCVSDTHNQHNKIKLPEGDVLIHAGDFSMLGKVPEVGAFLKWFGEQPHKHKVLIAGNHDWLFERESTLATSMVPEGVTYLNDSGAVIEGLNFWGSPVQPEFGNWAFNRNQFEIDQHWQLIPSNTDVLITHGPPRGVLDWTVPCMNEVGCPDLLSRVLSVKPKLHVFGHIHEAYGQKQFEDTLFVNAALCDECYYLGNPPIVVDL